MNRIEWNLMLENVRRRLDPCDYPVWLALIAAAWTAFSWAVFDSISTFSDDSVSYLLLARCWSPWKAANAYELQACIEDNSLPLFPFLLSVVGGAHDLIIAHGVVVTAWLLSAVVLWRWSKRLLGTSQACGIVIVYLVTPICWLHMLGILSETLYLFLSLAVFLTIELHFSDPRDWRRFRWNATLALAILLGACTLTRAVGLAIPLGILISVFVCYLRTRRFTANLQGMTLASLASLGIAATWYSLYSPGAASQDSYAEVIDGVMRGMDGTTDWLGMFLDQLLRLSETWLGGLILFWKDPFQPNFLVACGAGLLALVGMFWRLRLGKADAWYALVYLCIIIFWPFPGNMPRFLYGIYPILLVQAFYLVHRWPGHLRLTSNHVGVLVTVVMLAAILPTTGFIYGRAQTDVRHGVDVSLATELYNIGDPEKAVRQALGHRLLLADLAEITALTSPTSRILWFAPTYLNLLSGRYGVGLEDWSVIQSSVELAESLDRSEVDYVLLTRINPRETRESFDGLKLLPFFDPLTQRVWEARGPRDQPRAILLKVDGSRLDTSQRAQDGAGT